VPASAMARRNLSAGKGASQRCELCLFAVKEYIENSNRQSDRNGTKIFSAGNVAHIVGAGWVQGTIKICAVVRAFADFVGAGCMEWGGGSILVCVFLVYAGPCV